MSSTNHRETLLEEFESPATSLVLLTGSSGRVMMTCPWQPSYTSQKKHKISREINGYYHLDMSLKESEFSPDWQFWKSYVGLPSYWSQKKYKTVREISCCYYWDTSPEESKFSPDWQLNYNALPRTKVKRGTKHPREINAYYYWDTSLEESESWATGRVLLTGGSGKVTSISAVSSVGLSAFCFFLRSV